MRSAKCLAVLLMVGCGDQLPNPKAWSTDETTATTQTPPTEVVVDGEVLNPTTSSLRPVFPPHGVTTPDSTPRFAWAPGGGDAAVLICPDRWCSEPLRRVEVGAASDTTLRSALAPGLYWWAVERNGERSFGRSFVVSAGAEDREVTGHWGMRVDLDADGYADVATMPTDGPPLVGIAYGGAELQYPRIWDGGTADEQSWIATTVAAVDHNGTGIDWLALGQADNNSVTLSPDYVRGRFDVVFEPGYGGIGTTVTAVGDVDGDGYGDVAVSSEFGQYVAVVFGGTDREDSRVEAQYGRQIMGPAVAGPADFDEDGFSDFVLRAERGVYIVYGGGDRLDRFERLDAPAEALDGFAESLAVGDANGDGRPDIVAGEASGCWTLFYASEEGFETFRNCAQGPVTSAVTRVALADHDADGLDELVTVHEEPFSRCGLRSVVLVWRRLDGDGLRVFEQDLPGARLVTPGDVDGDGAADVVIVAGAELTMMPFD